MLPWTLAHNWMLEPWSRHSKYKGAKRREPYDCSVINLHQENVDSVNSSTSISPLPLITWLFTPALAIAPLAFGRRLYGYLLIFACNYRFPGWTTPKSTLLRCQTKYSHMLFKADISSRYRYLILPWQVYEIVMRIDWIFGKCTWKLHTNLNHRNKKAQRQRYCIKDDRDLDGQSLQMIW